MTAYMVLTHTVHDAEAFARDNVPAITPVLRKHHIEVIALSLDTARSRVTPTVPSSFEPPPRRPFASSTTTSTSRDRSRSATR